MNTSFTPQANPRFGMLALAKDWDKSNQDVGADKEVQARREKNYQHLQTQEQYISTAYGEELAQFEKDFGLDFIIETQPADSQGELYTGEGDAIFKSDRFRINMVKRQDQEVLYSTGFEKFYSSQSVQSLASTIKSLVEKSVSQLQNSLEKA